MKWKLVTLFTQVHGLKIDTTILKKLADENDWVSFLYEVDDLGIELNAAIKLLKRFSDSALRDQLKICLSQIMDSAV